jgi:phosphate/sulfate permease
MVVPVQGGSPGALPAKKKTATWVIVLIVCLVASPVVIGVFAAIAVFGVRKYITNAKKAEATQVVQLLAKSVANCATAPDETGKARGLPESAPPVPSDFASVSGKKYQSSASEWSAAAYTCSSFALTDPQYFQYAYRKLDATRGEVIALADLDADGVPDEKSTVTIECSADGATCNVGPIVE